MPTIVQGRTHSSTADALNPSKFQALRVHFVGIGGCGMSGLARMLLDRGAVVSGSDAKPNEQTFDLAKRGVRISRDQLGELLDGEIDLVVRTAAVPDGHTEMLAAKRLGLRTVKYAELLGEVMAERVGVAVAGTHGKSTTTAMISHALLSLGLDPSFVVGGTVPQLGGGAHSGAGDVFVAEACEYDRSFHHLQPTIAVVTNVEEDHLDCYKDIGEIIASFRKFVGLVPAEGVVIANGQDAHCAAAISGAAGRVETVAVGDPGTRPPAGVTWFAEITGLENGCHAATVYRRGARVATMTLSVPGRHNLMNAVMALAACGACGAELIAAAKAVGTFTGVDRRMTEVGRFNGAVVVDDYGHHPTEIRATLAALRERYQPKRLVCVFQPHQHSRTRHLLDDFAVSFTAADETIVPDIYFVRDSDAERQRVSSADLVARVTAAGQFALHMPVFSGIVSHLRHTAGPGDLIVTMGAGNVWEIGRDLIS